MDKDAQTVARYSYDAWGVCTNIVNHTDLTGGVPIADINPFRYRGYYYDSEIGLYYLQSRYYDAGVGRFVNCDDVKYLGNSGTVISYNLFSYCENCIIMFFDDTGNLIRCLDIYDTGPCKITIMTIGEFKIESELLKCQLLLNGHKDVKVVKITPSNFREKWNNLSSRDIVIINCHSNPQSMSDKKTIISYRYIENLKSKSIKCLIMLGCNAGHLDHSTNNIACAFTKKISGCVFASDGTVKSKFLLFRSVGDSDWKKHRDTNRKQNEGWVVYSKTEGNVMYHYSAGLYKISIPSAIKYLEKKRFLSRSAVPNNWSPLIIL